MLALTVAGDKVTTSSILTVCPSLPYVHTSLLSILTILFCLTSSHSQKKGSIGRRREARHLPQAAARHISGAAVQHGVSRTVLSVQGDEVTWDMCYPLRTREWSMPDRRYAEDSSHFRCQTQYLYTGSDV